MSEKPEFILPPRITLSEALQQSSNSFTKRRAVSEADRPSKKGHPRTEEEHAAFLEGLQRFGKGSWLAISRHCVKTRNPTQIASHAQKYFLRVSQGVARSSRFTAIEQEHTGAAGRGIPPSGAKTLRHAGRVTPMKRCAASSDGEEGGGPQSTSRPQRPHTSAHLNSGIRRPQPVRVQAIRDVDALGDMGGAADPKPYIISLQTSAGSAFSALPASPSSPPVL